MKKTTQTLLLVFSTLLLLVSVAVSAQGQPSQPTPRPTPGPDQDRLRGNSAGFAGTWNTVTDKGKTIVITLEQNRQNIVTGSYPAYGLTGSYKPSDRSINLFVKVSASMAAPVPQEAASSSITGTVTGNVLRFTWRELPGSSNLRPARYGAGRFTLSSDGESFEGTYSLTNNPDDTSGGTWNGTRQHSFAGAWQGKFGESFMQLILQQSGDRIGGQINVNSANVGLVSDGTVNGNTLRFNILRVDPRKISGKPEFVGTGELVMERGGKSFTGTVLGAAASGTLVAR